MKKISFFSLLVLLFLCTSCSLVCRHTKTIIEEVPSTCISNGYVIKYCDRCHVKVKETLPVSGHDWVKGEVIKPLTYTENEEVVYKCNLCDFTTIKETSFDDISNREYILKDNGYSQDIIDITSLIDKFTMLHEVCEVSVYEILEQDDIFKDPALLSYKIPNNISFKANVEQEDFGYSFTIDYVTEPIKSSPKNNIPKYNNLNLQKTQKTRSDDFNYFAIEQIEETLFVETTEQLSSCLMKGIKPICRESSSAYYVYELMKQVLRDIITDDMSDFAKLLAIHDFLCTYINYDYYVYEQRLDPLEYESGWLEGVFFEKQGLCGSLANAFTSLCNIEGIICLTVTGVSKENNQIGHAWNKVYLDGNWYIVDLTGDIMPLTVTIKKEVTLYQSFLIDDAFYIENYDTYIFNEIRCTKNYNKYEHMKYTYIGIDWYDVTGDFVIDSYDELVDVINFLEVTTDHSSSISILMNYEYSSFEEELARAYQELNFVYDSLYYTSRTDEYIIVN